MKNDRPAKPRPTKQREALAAVQEAAETLHHALDFLPKEPMELLAHPYFADKRPIPLTIIRPSAAIPVSLDSFTREDIRRMVEQGRQDARAILAQGTVSEGEV